MPADMNDYFKKRTPRKETQERKPAPQAPINNGNKLFSTLMFLMIAAGALIILKPFTIINSGEVGIKVTTGKFQDEPLNPGLTLFYIPMIEKIIPVNNKS